MCGLGISMKGCIKCKTRTSSNMGYLTSMYVLCSVGGLRLSGRKHDLHSRILEGMNVSAICCLCYNHSYLTILLVLT